jgi:hypothetical protein
LEIILVVSLQCRSDCSSLFFMNIVACVLFTVKLWSVLTVQLFWVWLSLSDVSKVILDVLSSVIVVSSIAILSVKRYHTVFPLLPMEMGRFLVSKKK